MSKKLNSLGIAGIVAAMILVVATSSRNATATASPPPSDFEPVGDEVGWDGLPSRIRHIPTGIILVLIPPGEFTMGSPETETQRDRDEAQHDARITKPFYLGETEVTIGEWLHVMGALPEEVHLADDNTLPIQGVSWHMAKRLVTRLNLSLSGSGRWRLPKEKEWEYACRAGTTTPFSLGANITPEMVNYNGKRPYADGVPGLNRQKPVPVRSLPANPWGLYEMHGNVWEWCADRYVVNPSPAPAGPSLGAPPDTSDAHGAARVLRGGAWTSKGKQARSANRDGYAPSSSGPKYGLRLAVSIATAAAAGD